MRPQILLPFKFAQKVKNSKKDLEPCSGTKATAAEASVFALSSPGALKTLRWVVLGGAICLSACMSSRREEELQTNIRNLEVKISDVEKQLASRDRNVDALKNTTEDANRKVQTTKGEMDDLRRQLSLTQGALDELRVKMTRLQETAGSSAGKNITDDGAASGKVADLDDEMTRMERRVARLELSAAPAAERAQKEKPKTALKFKTPGELNKSLAAAYVQKDYRKVVTAASDIISSPAADDQKEIALDFRGRAYFQLQNYEKAAIDLTEFLEKYPKSDKRPMALLLAGDSFVYLKQLRAAKSYYAECVKIHPEREECKASKERLEKLGV